MTEREINPGTAGSWIRRAPNDAPVPTHVDREFGLAVASVPAKADAGWDPREVWLLRIHQPRRSRAEDEFQAQNGGSIPVELLD